MPTPRILATAPISPLVDELLGRFGSIEVASNYDEESLISLMPGAIALIVRGAVHITRPVIEAGRELRVIGRTGVGFETIDVQAATEHGIAVVNTPGANSRAVAEAALGMILALAKRLPELDRETRAGRWDVRYTIRFGDLDQATLGIIGLGAIGVELAKLTAPFNMHRVAYDPWAPRERFAALGIEQVELDELLSRSDYISLHVPLTDESRGLLGRSRLASIKRGAVLVNLARGGLFDSLDDVYEALQSGQLSAVGLDVYPDEPPDFRHPIFSHPCALLTPHTAGGSEGAMRRIYLQMCEGMIAVLEGTIPNNVVNRTSLLPPSRLL